MQNVDLSVLGRLFQFRSFSLCLLALIISLAAAGQATLPLTRTAWGSTPTGWTDNGTQRTSTFACSGSDGGSLQATGKSYKVFFDVAPAQLSFSLKGSNPTTGSFKVQESPDGSAWTDVSSYTSISGSTCANQSFALLTSSRYVQFIFITKTAGNVDIDDVSITASACTTPADPTGVISGTTPACNSTSLSFSNPSANYYWQTSATGTSTVNPTTSSLTVSSSGSYYVRAYNGSCWSSGAVGPYAVTINTQPSISTHPSTPSATCGSFTGNLIVTATATNPIYQWQYSADGSTNWQSVTDGVPNAGVTYTNANGAMLTITGLTQTYYFRGTVGSTGCTTVNSNAALVTVNPSPAAPVAIAGSSVGSTSFTANWNTVGGASLYYLDVYSYVANSNLASWTFPTSGSIVTPDTYSTSNSTQTLTTNSGTISDAAGATTQAASATGWNSGSGSKYWQIQVDATGFYSLKLSSKQKSSNTGPRDFKVQYKLGAAGTWTDVSGGTVPSVLNDNFVSGVVNNLTLPVACDNQSSVYIRWIMTSNTAVDGTGVASGGTSRIDDISVTGSAFTYVSGFQNASTTDNFMEVTGLSASTTYYYVVRASNGTCSSANSNIITVTTDVPCTPSATISSFSPTTGPANTLVTITGTGFTGATAVKFGSISASSFTVVNSTTITARVPTNAPTDKISVTVSACPAISTTSFTPIFQSGTCGTVATASDLFISEVYDAESGSLSYIEVFNGTLSSVNLSAYVVRVRTGTSTDNDYALTGTLASGGTHLLLIGSSTVSCSVSSQQSFTAGSGFNGNDRIYLRKSGVDIDYVPNPNYGGSSDPGFSQVRRSTSIGPSTTYTAADWIITSTESCTSLGVAPYTVGGSSITVATQPADVSCNTISFNVSANTTGTGTLAYVWKYNAPGSSSWSLVSSLNGVGGIIVTGSGTNTITLSGNTASLNDYQFYAELTFGSCSVISNAAQYKYNSLRYYRSKSNGAWNVNATWEMSSDNSTWVSVCNYPIASNSSEVTVNHTVTLDLDVDIDKITIATGATLDISATGKLTVYDSTAAAADLLINGTLVDGGSSSNGIAFGTGASWTMGSAATLVRTSTSSSTNYRDNYYLGMSNIPATANWIIRKSGSTDVSFTTVAGSSGSYPSATYYPNLTFENASGSPYVFTSKFTGASDYARVKGNIDIGGTTYTTAVTVINDNTNTNPLLVSGNLVVRSGSALTNAGTSSGTGFEVKGNLTVDGTLTINNSTTGLLKFSGNTTQTISGGGTMNLQDVTLANTGGGSGVLVNRSLGIPGVLSFAAASKLTFGTGDISLKSSATSTARVAEFPTDASINYTGAGRFYVERYISKTRRWHLLGVPTNTSQKMNEAWQEGATTITDNPAPGFGMQITDNNSNWASQGFDALSPGGPSVKTFSPAVGATPDSWVGIGSTTINIKTSGGYMNYIRGDRLSLSTNSISNPTVLRTKGLIYTGTTSVSVNPNKFAVIGNPYPSAVDLRLVTKDNLLSDIYIWDPYLTGTYGLGGFRTLAWDGTNYLPVPSGGTGPYSGSTYNYINSGVAFFVKGAGAGSCSITFNESNKTSTTDPISRNVGAPLQSLRVNILAGNSVEGELLDGGLAIFGNYSNDADGQDAEKLSNNQVNLGFMRNGKLLSVERRGRITAKDTLYLQMSGLRVASYTFQVTANNLISPSRKAWLVDNYLNTKQSIDLGSTSLLNFEINNQPASYAPGRFYIVFQTGNGKQEGSDVIQPGISALPKAQPALAVSPNPIVGKTMNLLLSNIAPGNYVLDLLNTNGQSVYRQSILVDAPMRTRAFQLPASLPAGSYRVMLNNGSDSPLNVQVIVD
jgi:hypothetical protein